MRKIKSKIIPSIALALSLTGCSTLEKFIINSDVGKEAIFSVQHRYMTGVDNPNCQIEDFGIAEKKDESPEKPILFFIYGWGGSLDILLNEGKNEGFSKVDVMREVFENRMIMADYPSNLGIEPAFLGLENPFLEFVKTYSENNSGKKPKIILVGNSFGSQIARLFARKYSSYFEKAGFIAGLNDGLNLGVWTDFVRERFPKYMREVLLEDGKEATTGDYQSIRDILSGSDFFKKINTPTEKLNLEYNFYAFVSKKDSWIIPGEDDNLTGLDSAYPMRLIREKKFENVDVGSVMVFKGDVDHFSMNNLEILREIMESLKSNNESFSYTEIIVPKCPPNEERIRKYEESLIKQIKNFS